MSKDNPHNDNKDVQEQTAGQQLNDQNDTSTDQVSGTSNVEFEQRIGELTEALQRERADAMNLRRRHEEAMASLKVRTKATIVRELLPVIDNFERALKHVPDDLAGHEYSKGVQGVVKQFEKTLSDMGVERIQTTGQPFDPRYHEAVVMEEGDGSQEIVAEELQSGYRVGDDIVRHAMVKVRTQ